MKWLQYGGRDPTGEDTQDGFNRKEAKGSVGNKEMEGKETNLIQL